MILEYNNDSVFVFDLDDTLYQEKDYLISAFNEIAEPYHVYNAVIDQKMLDLYNNEENVFNYLIHNYPSVTSDKNSLLKIYREHKYSNFFTFRPDEYACVKCSNRSSTCR